MMNREIDENLAETIKHRTDDYKKAGYNSRQFSIEKAKPNPNNSKPDAERVKMLRAVAEHQERVRADQDDIDLGFA